MGRGWLCQGGVIAGARGLQVTRIGADPGATPGDRKAPVAFPGGPGPEG